MATPVYIPPQQCRSVLFSPYPHNICYMCSFFFFLNHLSHQGSLICGLLDGSYGASLIAQLVKNLTADAGDLGSIPGLGRSPGEGNGNPLQYSCLENPMDRGAWRATVHEVARVGHDLATKPPPPF